MSFNAGDIEATLTLDRTPFIRGLDQARVEAERFASGRYEAHLDVRDDATRKIEAARASARELETQLNRVGSQKTDVKMDSSQVDKTASTLSKIPPMAGLIAAAFPPAAAAIAALPAAAALVITPIAAVATGLGGIKTAVQQLAPQFMALKTAVSATFEQGLQPAVANVNAIMPALQQGLVGTATALSSVATQITDVVANSAGIGQLQNIFAGINNLLTNLGPGLALFTDNVLKLADAGAQGMQGFAVQFLQAGEAWRSMVDAMVASGTAQAAIQGLFSLLASLLQLLAPVVQLGAQLMAVLGPPLAAAVDILTGVLTPLVNLLGAIPGPVQLAALALAGLALVMNHIHGKASAAADGVKKTGQEAEQAAPKMSVAEKAAGALGSAYGTLAGAATVGFKAGADAVHNFGQAVTAAATTSSIALSNNLITAVTQAGAGVRTFAGHVETSGARVTAGLNSMATLFTGWGARVNKAVDATGAAVLGLGPKFETAFNTVSRAANTGTNSVLNAVGRIPAGISVAAQSVERGVTAAGAAVTRGADAIAVGVGRIPTVVTGAMKSLEQGVTAAGSGVTRGFEGMVAGAQRLPAVFSSAADSVRAAVARIPGAVGEAVTSTGTHLRNLGNAVQTGLVSAFERIPTVTAEAGAGVTRFAQSAAGAATGGLNVFARGAQGLIGALGGGWGVAITAATTLLGALGQQQQEAARTVAELSNAIREQGGVINDNVRAIVSKKAEDAGLLEVAQKLGISAKDATDAVLNQTGALDANRVALFHGSDAVGQLSIVTKAASSDAGGFTGFLGGLAGTILGMGSETAQAANKITDLNRNFLDSIESAKRLTAAQQSLADSSNLNSVKAANAARETAVWTKAMEALAKASAGVADKVKALTKAYAEASEGPRTYAEATRKADDALRALHDAATTKLPPGIVDLTGKINSATKQGSEFSKMMNDAADASDKLAAAAQTQAMEMGKGPVEQYAAGAAALVQYRQKMIDVAVASGVGREEAIKMAAALRAIPPEVITKAQVVGAPEAIVKALGLKDAIKGIPEDHAVTVTALTAAAEAQLTALGFKATHMHDGTIRIEPDTKAADAAIDKFKAIFPLHGSIDVGADTSPAQQAIDDLIARTSHQVATFAVNAATGKGGAYGMIAPGFAPGGTFPGTPFQAGTAQVFPPNQLRYTGDRNRDDEFYIPDDKTPRSLALLAELAKRRGFQLLPMADGGVAPTVPTAGVTSGAAGLAGAPVPGVQIPLTPETAAQLVSRVAALTQAVTTLNPAVAATNTAFTTTTGTVNTLSGTGLQRLVAAVTGLLPVLSQMASQVTGTTVPSVTGLQTHLGLLTTQLAATTTGAVGSWQTMTATTQTSVTGQQAAMSGLEQGLGGVRSAVGNTATWFADRMGSMRSAAADPIRFVITGPFNAGLIAAWNKLNAEFALGKAVEPLAVGFATGGEIPASMHGAPPRGSTDTVPAWLTPDEIVINRDQAQRHRNFLLALNSGQPEAVQAAGGMYSRGPGYAAGGSVEAVQQFAAAQSGKPYVWGGVGPDGFDCSGFASALVNTALGSGSPFHRLGTTNTMPWAGLTPGLTSAFGLGWSSEHMASTIGGLNAEAGGSPSLVKFNRPDAAGATHPQFGGHASVPQVGGVFVGGPGGGGIDAQAVVDAAFAEAYRLVAQIVPTWPGNTTAAQGAGISKQAVDQVKAAALAKVSAVAGSAGPGGGAGVQRWAPVVDQALGMVGQPLSYRDTTLRRMNQESGGNPAAVNLTDSNAAAGHPSVGLMQVIAGTYAAYKDARRDVGPYAYGVSEDPLSNVLASMHYAIRQYGSLPAAYDRAGGYDQGGLLMPGLTAALNTTGVPEQVLNPATTENFGRLTEWLTTDVGQRVSAGAASNAGGVDPGQLVSAVRTVVGEVVAAVPRPLIGGNVQVGGDRQFADVDELLFKIRHARHEGIYAR